MALENAWQRPKWRDTARTRTKGVFSFSAVRTAALDTSLVTPLLPSPPRPQKPGRPSPASGPAAHDSAQPGGGRETSGLGGSLNIALISLGT